MGDDDQCLNGQAGAEGGSDLRGRSDSPDPVLSACVRMDASVDLEWRQQPEKILVFRLCRILLSPVRYCDGSIFESVAAAADSQENVRKDVEIRAVPGYTVSMFIVLRVKEWTRRYGIL